MMNGEKLDLAKRDKLYYTASLEPRLVHFPELNYVALEGQGDPNGERFRESTEALYTVAYGVKGLCKSEQADFTVAKLEGLWWVDSDAHDPLTVPREEWRWRIMIRMPDFVTAEKVTSARLAAAKKKPVLAGLIQSVAYLPIHEGDCVQIMHIGPYSEEPATLKRMDTYMSEHGLTGNGLHHEIYLSDPRRSAPSTRKTILRLPVRKI
ncbi:GyrI-like domain-containing protein [Paenibacillus sp. NPDC057967]|uniref:GyrI-like domain-containing protein n=1 Tax=Paenibacillus sp. NPDC057967 TaxID=3346293 RepID=UPI0036D8B34C